SWGSRPLHRLPQPEAAANVARGRSAAVEVVAEDVQHQLAETLAVRALHGFLAGRDAIAGVVVDLDLEPAALGADPELAVAATLEREDALLASLAHQTERATVGEREQRGLVDDRAGVRGQAGAGVHAAVRVEGTDRRAGGAGRGGGLPRREH